ncbi:hypothetical protein Patl1_19890 [Pistacia atlantica]|uniref:Uncharacterized protein n=1 Tax=Pistacia atlantica TaxID=434234 RepID=A0ACC1BJ31_9ROSI|nr:hypothetical protein Patl1_19890 [Pistacia atlantica]
MKYPKVKMAKEALYVNCSGEELHCNGKRKVECVSFCHHTHRHRGYGDEKCSGACCLMDCSLNSCDKKTLKRWFFIDKRVG